VRTVGLIGLGLLGSALVERLQGAGWRVVGYDIAADRREILSAWRGEAVVSAAEVAKRCQQIILSLPDSDVVSAVIDQMGSALQRGQIVVDTTTGEPEATAALAESLAQRGVEYLDVTIVGSSEQVRQGEVITLAGGSEAAFRQITDLVGTFARQVFHVGPCGAGARMKLVVNLVLGLNRAVLAEGLTLGGALGLDAATCLEVLRSGAAYSTVMDIKGAKMISGDFAPQARLSQHLKDVRLMLAAAERTGIELPLSSLHRELLERAEAAGYGELDNSAVIRAFDR